MAKKSVQNNDQEEHLKNLYSSLSLSAQQFDKQCLLIASGAFSLSFAFISDIIPDLTKAINKAYLTSAWGFFLGVIFVGLISHFISTTMLSMAIKHSDLDNNEFNRKIKPWNIIIQGFNIITILGLLIGSILLISFISTNLNYSNTMSKQQNNPKPSGPKPGSPGTLSMPIPPRVSTPPPKK